MTSFVPGLHLAERFYREAVLPLLEQEFPDVAHSAARVGGGSEVFQFDTPRSADHEWGPRLQLFVSASDAATRGERMRVALAQRLPKHFLGWPTHFDGAYGGIGRMAPTTGPVAHRVSVASVSDWCLETLGFDAHEQVSLFDWLATPWQRLAEAVRGAVFHDGLGLLEPLRVRLAWYPDDVWRYVLACQWQRIAEEEAFPGRCAEVGDDLGGRVVTSRIARDVMRLALLMQRRYPLYGKWLGSEVATVPQLAPLAELLGRALTAPEWPERERSLGAALTFLAGRHNALGLTEPLDVAARPFHDRPFQVIGGERFAAALADSLTGESLKRLPLVGAVDQFVDSTAVLCDPRRSRAVSRAVLGSLTHSSR